ncbi:LysR family transcriptional regulator [Cupriavidus sp. amp6]|uniref:LysR family transcriptional regulator n=1 Tax=Cupriavidus sp. amp6 TaxID=388051 RepID=UPI00040DE6C0|nr:LysR family transcriptional regulator [Cupriavidus sp. amp6]
MNHFIAIEAFVRVAETCSFAEAARQLGVAGSIVTSRVQQLEKFVGAPLFHRNTRHVRLSELGEAYYKECAEAVAQLNSLTDQMRDLKGTPTGRLRIHMLPGYAIGHFGELLNGFMQRYGGIQLDIIVSDRVVDPIEEGFDVAFQIFPPISSLLIERRLFPVRRLFCATPEYLERHGVPVVPTDLLDHTTALYAGYPSRNRWAFTRGDESVSLELPGQVRSNSVHLLRDYAESGACIVCLPTLVASEALRSGRLLPVLTDYKLAPFSFAAVYPTTQRQAIKVKMLVDFLAERLAGEPEWDVPLLARGWVS